MSTFDLLVSELAKDIAERVLSEIRDGAAQPKLLLTAKEVAVALGVTESAFNQADWKREIPVVKLGIQNRYTIADLQLFIANNRQGC